MIFVLDTNILVHQFWHMANTKSDGDPDLADVLDWILIRLDNLKRYLDDLSAQHGGGEVKRVAVFDSTKSSFRKELVEEYKQQRTRVAGVYELVADTKEAVISSDDWIGLIAPDGYEADDLIASIAHQASEPVIIHSSDKDFNQCLQDGKVGIIKRSGIDEPIVNQHGIPLGGEMIARHYRERDLIREYGFGADRWVDYQCLVGDVADNVKGCRGVGPKRAKELLTKYDSFFEVTDDDLNKLQRANWQEWLEDVDKLREVFTLRTDLDFRLE